MKIAIVTGCNGFIGNKLCNFLVKKKYKVYGFDVTKSYFLNKNLIFNSFDNLENLIPKLKGTKSTVFHFAWCGVSSLDKNNENKQNENHVLTKRVLSFADQIKARKIIIPGSMSEFAGSTEPITGEEKPSPSDFYASTKIKVREETTKFCNEANLDFNWLLITSVYGGNRNDSNLLTSCIDSLLQNKQFACTNLEQQWDYIHIDDLIEAIYLIAKKGERNSIYPIGSGNVCKLSHYVETIGEVLNKKSLLKVGDLPYKSKFIDNSIPNINKLKKLGFVPKVTFSSGIKKMIAERKQLLEGKRVSVVMTSYNGSLYIEEQVKSILTNLKENDELLVSDDGSTDSTKDILLRLSKDDNRLRVLDGPKKGLNKNIEYLYSKVAGEYIFVSDQDDIWHPNKVDVILQYFQSNPEAIAIHHNSNLIDKKGNIFGELYKTISFSNKLSKFLVKSHIFGSMIAFKKELLQYDIIPPKNIYDAGIACFSMRLKQLIFVDDILMDYRRHESNVSSWKRPLGVIIKERLHLLFYMLKKVLFLKKRI